MKNQESEPGPTGDTNQEEKKSTQDINLSVAATSLNKENEDELTKFLIKRLSKGCTYAGNGHISGLEFSVESQDPLAGSSLCYYCVLQRDDSHRDTGAIDVIPEPDILQGSTDFVLCLLASQDVMLDAFRPELNKFSQRIFELLDSDLSDLDHSVKPVLSNWYSDLTLYLTSTVNHLQEDVKYVIYAALIDAKLDVMCADDVLKRDVIRFYDCCSLSELLEPLQANSGNSACATAQLVDINIPVVSTVTSIKLSLEGDDIKAEPKVCSSFCDDWASTMVSTDNANPIMLRQIIESYKFKVIQDLNTLKRLLREAEKDFYALYRCYIFLKQCGNSRVLLHYVAGESAMPSEVLVVLQEMLDKPASAS